MAEHDTAVRSGHSQFPPTAWTLLGSLRDPKDPRVRACLDHLVEIYWRPVYKYVRIAWKRSNEDAKDLTQGFFVHLLEGDLLSRADPERGNFRKLLLAALRNFLANDHRDAQAVKRGGGRQVVSIDTDAGSDWAGADPADPQAAFESQWAREVLERAIDRLQQRCRPEVFAAFRRFHLEDAAVKAIAAELRATEAQVSHYLQDARTALRSIVTDEIRQYVQDDAEIARELDALFRGWR
jgi:RNA polymerase sigma-70 factor (ECF subfamily)